MISKKKRSDYNYYDINYTHFIVLTKHIDLKQKILYSLKNVNLINFNKTNHILVFKLRFFLYIS